MSKLETILQILRSKNIGYATFHSFYSREKDLTRIMDSIRQSCHDNTILLENKNLFVRKFNFISKDKVIQEIEKTYESNAKFLIFDENNFPSHLKTLTNYPPLLIYKGNIANLHNNYISAISGSRKSSQYSAHVSYSIAKMLMEKKCVIATGVSGIIDISCHNNTYSQQIGVSSFSISKDDVILNKILNHNGTVVTDVGAFEQTAKYTFLRRNKLLIGLSKIAIIVESDINSGAYQTAIAAADAGRNIYVMDHFSKQNLYEGNKKLILDGAEVFKSINQILNDLYDLNLKHLEMQDQKFSFIKQNNINSAMKEDIINLSIKKYGNLNFQKEAIEFLSAESALPYHLIQQILLEFSIIQ